MNTKLLATGRRLFTNDLVPRSTVRHNIRAWSRSVHQLGEKWLLAVPKERLQ